MRVLNASFVPRAGACTALRTSPLRPTRTYCLPSLVIVGAMRAGTSALCDLLSKQPRYARNADGREVHYFSDPFASPRKLANAWPAYAARFPRTTRDELVFEKTAQYLTSPGGLAAMFAVLGPALRVVAVLREPGARLYSEFQHHCAAGRRRGASARRSTGPRNGTALPRGAVVRGDVLPTARSSPPRSATRPGASRTNCRCSTRRGAAAPRTPAGSCPAAPGRPSARPGPRGGLWSGD
ncbi:[heparan sulfate]-glucosamine N-sulfotransferase [Aureococcus anophagefferens]|nr:[heparan sulfate]-glucosamine N-sulfotransferase [Aureococcus anophagefferens]